MITMNGRGRTTWALLLATCFAAGGGALAQTTSDPEDPPAPTQDAPPSLDELLGLDEDDGERAAAAADQDSEDELEQQLRNRERVASCLAESVVHALTE